MKKEWIALCRTCNWSGKRAQDKATAQKDVETHLKSHSGHNIRLLVTGGQDPKTPAYEAYNQKRE